MSANAAAWLLQNPNSANAAIWPKISFAVTSSTPWASAPRTNGARSVSMSSLERARLIARRSLSASAAVNPATAIETRRICSWNRITPSVSLRIGSRSGCAYGTGSRPCRRWMYGLTMFPCSGPGRMIATSTTMSAKFRGRTRGSAWACARLSTWNRPIVSTSQMRS